MMLLSKLVSHCVLCPLSPPYPDPERSKAYWPKLPGDLLPDIAAVGMSREDDVQAKLNEERV
jgi:hypothetical protein